MERKTVQMKLLYSSIEKIEKIQKYVKANSRTDVIAQAIAVYDLLLTINQEKGDMYAFYPDKSREHIIIPYFNKNKLL